MLTWRSYFVAATSSSPAPPVPPPVATRMAFETGSSCTVHGCLALSLAECSAESSYDLVGFLAEVAAGIYAVNGSVHHSFGLSTVYHGSVNLQTRPSACYRKLSKGYGVMVASYYFNLQQNASDCSVMYPDLRLQPLTSSLGPIVLLILPGPGSGQTQVHLQLSCSTISAASPALGAAPTGRAPRGVRIVVRLLHAAQLRRLLRPQRARHLECSDARIVRGAVRRRLCVHLV